MDRYKEIIKELNCKPRLNLTWYKNEDLYSEGDIEDDVIQLITENEPEKYVDAIQEKFSWSSFYHLTHIRKNILNWYPFRADADVLEIGCGMGAVTGMLCDNCKSVTAVELSKRRATAALLRCREKENLEIIVGNLNDIEFEKKFDYITLIGVLEYQGSYTDTQDPYMDFLKKIKTLLKLGGRLLIAIENQFGLKYWCGAREDHTGIPFEGMNRYIISGEKARTFSKAALEELIKRSGFKHTFFYYPMPDYKLPTVVYSEALLPQNGNMNNMLCYYVPDGSTLIAREQKLYQDIVENGVFEFFANSFLVECSDSNELGEVIFAKMSSERLEEFRIGTRMMRAGKVQKYALAKEKGQGHLLQTFQNEKNLAGQGLRVWQSSMRDQKLVCDYSKLQLAEDKALEYLHHAETEKVCGMFDRLYEDIMRSSGEAPWEKNVLYSFGLARKSDRDLYGTVLQMGYLDMNLRNAFYDDGGLIWFDQEWALENVPAKYVLHRAINEFYVSYPEAARLIPRDKIDARYGLSGIADQFQSLDALFFGVVIDSKHMHESFVFRAGGDWQNVAASINRILKVEDK